jgi:hypothetical protein
MRNAISIALAALALAGCRVDGDSDADPDADGDQSGDADDDGARVQFCPPEGGDSGSALCALDAACCEDPAGEHYCCPAPANVCVSDGTCREPCDPAVEEICAVVGVGGAVGCAPDDAGMLACADGAHCWGLVLQACETGTCQVIEAEGVVVCR